MNQRFMREKPILPLLLSMALPMVVSMLVRSEERRVGKECRL